MITAFLVLMGGSAIGSWLGNWHANKWIEKHKIGSKQNKGCEDVFVCSVEDKPEISKEKLEDILGDEPVRYILPTDRQPSPPRKMAKIIKRKPVDPIDEIVNENGGSDSLL